MKITRLLGGLGLGVMLALSACAGNGTTTTPSTVIASAPATVGTVTSDANTALTIASAALTAYAASPQANAAVVTKAQGYLKTATQDVAVGSASASLAVATLQEYLAAQAALKAIAVPAPTVTPSSAPAVIATPTS